MTKPPGNVVFLKFKSATVQDDTMAFLSCGACRNKTYTRTSLTVIRRRRKDAPTTKEVKQ